MNLFNLNLFEYLKKVSIKWYFLIILLSFFSATSVHAQIDIKSKIDAQTISDYSIAIDLFESLVNANDSITLFIPINYGYSRLSQEKQNLILIDKKANDVNIFLNNHSANGLYDIVYFDGHLSSNTLLNKVELKSLNSIFFEKNSDKYLLGDSPNPSSVKFETHIVKTVKLNGKVVLNFLDGIFLF
jgi:hypothetical protein